MMLRFYCDESYDSQTNDPSVFVVGGVVADETTWRRVEDGFSAANLEAGVKQYHAAHVNALSGEFEKWRGTPEGKQCQIAYSKRLLRALIAELSEPCRTLVITASVTGLRRGELFGLKWNDVDFQNGKIRILRSVVDHVENQPKTAASGRPVPLTPSLSTVLTSWKRQTPYSNADDWVFASPAAMGKMPYWPDMLLKRRIRPAAKVAGISKNIGWHTFRRTTATLLLSTGANVRVAQELMRHASPVMTLGTYSQALDVDKWDAQSTLAVLIAGQASSADKRKQRAAV